MEGSRQAGAPAAGYAGERRHLGPPLALRSLCDELGLLQHGRGLIFAVPPTKGVLQAVADGFVTARLRLCNAGTAQLATELRELRPRSIVPRMLSGYGLTGPNRVREIMGGGEVAISRKGRTTRTLLGEWLVAACHTKRFPTMEQSRPKVGRASLRSRVACCA